MTHPTTDFTFACVLDSSTQDYFRMSEDPMKRNMYTFMKPYMTTTISEGIQNILNGWDSADYKLESGNIVPIKVRSRYVFLSLLEDKVAALSFGY